MPYARHIRCTALGVLAGTDERFSYSFALEIDRGANTFNSFTDLWEDIAADVVAFHADPNAVIHPKAVLTEVKFAEIGENGLYTDDPIIVNVPNTAGGTNTTGAALATILPQAALVISLETERRGASGKGRFYLPMPTVSLGDDLRMSESVVGVIRTAAQTFLNNVNNRQGPDGLNNPRVVVASSKGYNSPVTGVRVGRVVDTMRSRRTSLPEAHTAPAPVG